MGELAPNQVQTLPVPAAQAGSADVPTPYDIFNVHIDVHIYILHTNTYIYVVRSRYCCPSTCHAGRQTGLEALVSTALARKAATHLSFSSQSTLLVHKETGLLRSAFQTEARPLQTAQAITVSRMGASRAIPDRQCVCCKARI